MTHRVLAAGPDVSTRAVSTRALWLGLAAIAAVWVVAASQWTLSETVVPWDAKNQSYAFFRFLASALHAGSTPFWNPYHYGGHPSVADPQSLIFAPAFMAWAWFDPEPSMRTFDLIVYAHLLVGGLAVGAMGWRMGWPMSAMLLAAAVFMLGGPASGRLQHTGMIISYGLFPLAMLLMQLALHRRSILMAAGFASVAAAMLLERNHVSLLLSFVLAAVFIGEVLAVGDRRRWLRERMAVIATMGIVGLLLIALPLLLTIQFATLSNRPHIQIDQALEASLYPANLATMAVGNVMGSLEKTYSYWGPNVDTLPAVGATDRSFNYLFVGATTVLVLTWFGIAAGGLVRQRRRLLTGILIVALLYAIGRYSPLYALAFEYMPGINLFRRPSDATFVVVAVLALLIGHLLTDYVKQGLPYARPSITAAAAAAVIGVILWAVMFSAKTGHGWDASWQVLQVAAIPIGAAALLWWASRWPRRREVAAACVALLAAGELIWFNTASSLNAEPPGYYAVLEQPQGEDAKALAVLEREIASRHREGKRPRVEIVGVSGSWQNVAMVRGLEASNGYNPLRIGWYDRLVSPGETTHLVDQRQFPPSFDGYDCALARELGLEFLVLGQPIEKMPHLTRRPIAEVLLDGPKIWIYRLVKAEPRVRFISRVMVANVDPDVQAGRFDVNPANETALIDDETPPLHRYLPGLRSAPGTWTKIVSWRPDRVQVEVNSRDAGVLVLHEAFYPGWTAEVDRVPTRIMRTNVLFRGVEVPEGRHTVVFRYAPFSFSNLRDAVLGLLHGKSKRLGN